MEARWCTACGELFQPRSQTPGQSYCARLECQRARKLLWQRMKRKSDPDYLANQTDAQRAWSQRNPSYWQRYRAEHPDYVARNRISQRRRDSKQVVSGIAKMDASPIETLPLAGLYRLTPIEVEGLAKKDAWIVRLAVVAFEPENE